MERELERILDSFLETLQKRAEKKGIRSREAPRLGGVEVAEAPGG